MISMYLRRLDESPPIEEPKNIIGKSLSNYSYTQLFIGVDVKKDQVAGLACFLACLLEFHDSSFVVPFDLSNQGNKTRRKNLY